MRGGRVSQAVAGYFFSLTQVFLTSTYYQDRHSPHFPLLLETRHVYQPLYQKIKRENGVHDHSKLVGSCREPRHCCFGKNTETMCERPSLLYIQLFWAAAAAAPHSTSSNKGILKGNRFSMRTFAPLAVDEGGVPFQEKKRQSSNRLKTKQFE